MGRTPRPIDAILLTAASVHRSPLVHAGAVFLEVKPAVANTQNPARTLILMLKCAVAAKTAWESFTSIT